MGRLSALMTNESIQQSHSQPRKELAIVFYHGMTDKISSTK